MPAKTQTNPLLAKMGDRARKAHETHKADPTTVGSSGDLPAGIEGGIARLSDIKIAAYKEGDKKGQPFFMARAIVVEPKEAKLEDGRMMATAGLATQVGPEPLCDTPNATGKRKTFEDHYAWFLNELRKLGVPTAELSFEELEAVMASLKESAPFVRFRTWKGKKATEGPYKDQEPRVQHDWRGTATYDGEAPEGSGVVDETDATGNEPEPDEPPAETEAAAPEEPAGNLPADVNELSVLADGDPSVATTVAAQERMVELAKASGVTDEVVSDAENWGQVAAAIQEAGGSASAEAPEEAAADDPNKPPAKGECYKYKPPRMRKPVECEVTAVFEGNQKCNLKNIDDNKTMYKSVPWAELIRD